MVTLRSPVPEWPRIVDESVERVLARLAAQQMLELSQMPESELEWLHFGFGAAIRNICGLWDGNQALLAAFGSPAVDPDTASAAIVRAVWGRLRGGE